MSIILSSVYYATSEYMFLFERHNVIIYEDFLFKLCVYESILCLIMKMKNMLQNMCVASTIN